MFAAKSEGCGDYGDGMEVAECTQGFPSLFHIDEVLGNTYLSTVSSRQVLVPGMNFTCSGTITRWIFGADWRGLSPALMEFQIWRKVSSTGSTYIKVAGTAISVGSSNNSGVYEYQLDTPLAFQEGDIFGYFQPISNRTELQLYLETSNRITTYQQSVCVDCLFPSPVGSNFSLTSALTGTSYPVIAGTTVPSDCGCGFMSVKRVRSLLSSTGRGYSDDIFRRESSVLFPSLNFTCRVNISKWTVAVGNSFRDVHTELHLWRKLGNLSSTLYEKVNNTVTMMSVLSRRSDNIYEFTPTTTVVAEPGDIVGLFISYSFRPLYERNSDMLYYWNRESQDEYFDILDSERGYGTPLITIEACKSTRYH
jgi:hypothetical protein